MTTFIEVSNSEFDDLYAASEVEKETIYGTEYAKSYEVLDKAKEYAHFIFPSKQAALQYVSRKYPDCNINEQLDLFEEERTHA